MNADTIALSISVVGVLIACASFILSWRTGYITRTTSNIWEIYKQYNSDDIKTARANVRAILQDPAWQQVKDLKSYQRYFQLPIVKSARANEEQQMLWQQEQDIHRLLSFYHQIGLLLKRHFLDENAILFLLGGGLGDRWDVLGRVPDFFSDHPYEGMFWLYDRYQVWKHHHQSLYHEPDMMNHVIINDAAD